jgi:hypothetical protein
MDFGDVHSIEGLAFAVEHCLKLDHIHGMVLAMFYDPEIAKLFGQGKDASILKHTKKSVRFLFLMIRWKVFRH